MAKRGPKPLISGAAIIEAAPAEIDDHGVGGPGGFLLPARGFADFERAIRRKFLTEISGAQPGDARWAEAR